MDSTGPGDAAVDSQRFVLSDRALRVGDVEPIDLNPQLTTFTKLDRIVGAEIQIVSCRGSIAASKWIDCGAAWNVETLVVAVYRMRNQGVERNT